MTTNTKENLQMLGIYLGSIFTCLLLLRHGVQVPDPSNKAFLASIALLPVANTILAAVLGAINLLFLIFELFDLLVGYVV